MSKIHSDMLQQTLNVLELARQKALEQGRSQQAETLAPVENRLRGLVEESAPSELPNPAPPVARKAEFQQLLQLSQNKAGSSESGELDRFQMMQSMAAAGMEEVEIARQMGITREEVSIAVRIGRRAGS